MATTLLSPLSLTPLSFIKDGPVLGKNKRVLNTKIGFKNAKIRSMKLNSLRRSLHVVRAMGEETENKTVTKTETVTETVTETGEGKIGSARKERERGQLTAIVTGAISIALGVAYLILVTVLDTRGIELIPPPPEAYGE